MARKTSLKPSAADRTPDLFTGKTAGEEADEARNLTQPDDAEDASKEAEPTIEANMDRYRDQAFRVQEWSSKHFGPPSFPGSAWRLSRRKVDGRDYYCLERTWSESGKTLASYGSILFLDEGEGDRNALYQLADVVVKAARSKKNGT